MPFSLAAREKLRRPTTSQKTLSDLRCMAELASLILRLQKMSSEHRRIVGISPAVNYRTRKSGTANIRIRNLARWAAESRAEAQLPYRKAFSEAIAALQLKSARTARGVATSGSSSRTSTTELIHEPSIRW